METTGDKNNLAHQPMSNDNIHQSVLTDVKKNLLERNLNNQVKSVHVIMEMLSSITDKNQFIGLLVREDIIDLLCEAMATTNDCMIQLLFNCLLTMSRYEVFYVNNDHTIAYTVQSVLRTFHMIFKNKTPFSTIKTGLYLLLTILKRTVQNGIKLNTLCPIEQLLSVILRILNSLAMKYFLSVALQIFCCLLEDSDICLAEKLQPSIKSLINVLSSILYSNILVDISKKCEITFLLSNLCNSSIIFHLKLELNKTDVTSVILPMIYQTIVPFVMKEYNKFPHGMIHEILLHILSFFTNRSNSAVCEIITRELVLSYFPATLFRISLYFRDMPKLHLLCNILLAEILCHISVTELKIDTEWPGGKTEFDNKMKQSITRLTKSVCYTDFTFNKLIDFSLDSSSSDVFFVMLLYYYDHSNRSSFNDAVKKMDLRKICNFIGNLLSPLGLPSPVIKVVWFNFAVAYMCTESPQCTDKSEINSIRIQFYKYLSEYTDLDKVYTHNFAILFVTFNMPIPVKKLQLNLMILWLSHYCKNRDKNEYQQVKKLCAHNEEVCFCLLDIICKMDNTNAVLTTVATEILGDVMKTDSSDVIRNLPFLVWSTIPQLLSSYISKSVVSEHNLIHVLKIALINVPVNEESYIDTLLLEVVTRTITIISSIVILEITVDLTSKLTFVLYLFRFLVLIASYSTTRKCNQKELEILFNHRTFIRSASKVLLYSEKTLNVDLHVVILQLCNILLDYQIFRNIECCDMISIDWNTVLFSISHKNVECAFQMIQLLVKFYSTYTNEGKEIKLLIAFETGLSVNILQRLYMQLLANVMKGDTKVACISLRGLTVLISKCKELLQGEYSDVVLKHLVLQPWMCYVIRTIFQMVKLQQNEIPLISYFLELFKIWISQFSYIASARDAAVEYSNKGPLSDDYLQETFHKVSLKILTLWDNKDNFADSNKKQLTEITFGILKTGLVSASLKESLEKSVYN